ncbi:MAG: hypothetical protein IKV88_04200 [Clostridia bacterium]|nr:hypothetical protein [Clostridia bacterium]
MKIENKESTGINLILKKEEAIELRDSLNDLIKHNDSRIHHHICSYNFDKGIIDYELIVSLE